MTLKELEVLLTDLYSKDSIYAIYKLLQESEKTKDNSAITRLCTGEPIQYILGYSWFYNLPLEVNTSTLIPRPETEELCYNILKEFSNKRINACDIGTGSGCIPITIAKNNKNSNFIAIDNSRQALLVAERNAKQHKVENQIRFIEQDFLSGFNLPLNLDLIVSNPPYIEILEKEEMEETVTLWEPHNALFPEGTDALVFYRHLLKLLMNQGNQECTLWAEINPRHVNELIDVFSPQTSITILQDISGNNRFIRAQKKGL